MPLITGAISTELYNFIQEANATQVENKDEAIRKFCVKIEELIYNSIRNATLTIPSGTVNVVAPPPTGVGTNPIPIVVLNGLT